jgi:hypothetical protein
MRHQGHRRTRGGTRRDTKGTGGHRDTTRTGGHSGGTGRDTKRTGGDNGRIGASRKAKRIQNYEGFVRAKTGSIQQALRPDLTKKGFCFLLFLVEVLELTLRGDAHDSKGETGGP